MKKQEIKLDVRTVHGNYQEKKPKPRKKQNLKKKPTKQFQRAVRRDKQY